MKTKNMIINALNKDLDILHNQKIATENYIKTGCGQFLNVGNDAYCGNYEVVLELFHDMIKWANKLKTKLNKLKNEPKDDFGDNGYVNFVYSFFEKTFDTSESIVFLDDTNTDPLDSTHHSLFPNLAKMLANKDVN